MNRRSFMKSCLIVVSAVAAGQTFTEYKAIASAAEAKQLTKPNIVFFLVDDMGWQDTSVPFHTEETALNDRYRTPNMERLAKQGVKFTQAYACALCSPTRISLMTGMNAMRHRVTNWTLHKNRSPDRNSNLIQPPEWNVNGMCMEPGVERTLLAKETLPGLLSKAGYKAIHVGKGHFGAHTTPGANPLNLGFDVNIAGQAGGGPGSYYGKSNFATTSPKWRICSLPGLEEYHGKDIYLNEVLTIKANKKVEKAVAAKKPFYLYMSHYAVHAPWQEDPRFVEKYEKAGLKGRSAVYASMIESMDKSLGDIMDNLKRLGVEDNTIIVFMSDNGVVSAMPRNIPLRGHKLTTYEGGIRVPMIVKWPGITEKSTVCNGYVIIEDVFPTFLEMAGVKIPGNIASTVDGVSFVPLLTKEGDYPADRTLFWHYPHTYNGRAYSSVRKGDWKLIYFHVKGEFELFNLREDISEKNNLAKSIPDKMQELAKELSNYIVKVKAQMPIDKRTGKPFKLPIELLNEKRTTSG